MRSEGRGNLVRDVADQGGNIRGRAKEPAEDGEAARTAMSAPKGKDRERR